MFAEPQKQRLISTDDLEAALRLLSRETAFEKSQQLAGDWSRVTVGLLGLIYTGACILTVVIFLANGKIAFFSGLIAILALSMLLFVLIRSDNRLKELKQFEISLEVRGQSPILFLYENEVKQLAGVEHLQLNRLVKAGLSEKEANWYSVAILPAVSDSLRGLRQSDREEYDAIKDLTDTLQSDPRPRAAEPVPGTNLWRVNVRRYVVIYSLNEQHKRVEIVEIHQASDLEVSNAS